MGDTGCDSTKTIKRLIIGLLNCPRIIVSLLGLTPGAKKVDNQTNFITFCA